MSTDIPPKMSSVRNWERWTHPSAGRSAVSPPTRAPVHPLLATQPDAYVVTANSAIPVAASIRSFYRALKKPVPRLSYVEANRLASIEYQYEHKLDQTEIERLRRQLNGAEHVTVVDQFVQSGQTLRLAGALLEKAGIATISAVRGRWYPEFNHMHVDKERLTCREGMFMKYIGERAVYGIQPVS